MRGRAGCKKCGGRGFVYDPYNNTAHPCAECAMQNVLANRGGVQPDPAGAEATDREPYHGFPPFEKKSETSIQAAADIEPRVGTLRRLVFDAIRNSGFMGMTDAEVEKELSMKHQTASARRRELHLQGLIGTESKRKNPSGSMASVWKVAALCEDPAATIAPVEKRRCVHCGGMT